MYSVVSISEKKNCLDDIFIWPSLHTDKHNLEMDGKYG